MRLFLAAALMALAGACAQPTEDEAGSGGGGGTTSPDSFLDGDHVLGSDVRDGSGEARAVLRLATRTDEAKLVAEMGLDPKVAADIVATRLGPDGLPATADDAPFKRLVQLDDVPGTTIAVWQQLLDYAGTLDLPAELDPCGRRAASDRPLSFPSPITDAVKDLVRVAATDRLEVWKRTSKNVTPANIEQLRSRMCAALSFDFDELDVEVDGGFFDDPVRLVVLDDASYGVATGAAGSYGVTFGRYGGDGDAFVVPVSGLRDLPELDDTLAHELVHVFQDRLAPANAGHPWFFIEGMAIDMGSHFGRARHGVVTGFVGPFMTYVDSGEARATWSRYGLDDETEDMGEVGLRQAISGFFVEYLRVLNPQPMPDVLARLLAAMIRVSDNGNLTIEKSFQAATGGLDLGEAKKAFEAWLDARPLGCATERAAYNRACSLDAKSPACGDAASAADACLAPVWEARARGTVFEE